MKAFRWYYTSNSGKIMYRSVSGFSEDASFSKLYLKSGYVKAAAKTYKNVTVEVIEMQIVGQLPLDAFKKEFNV